MAHSSCGNSSNISGNLNVRNITNSGSRLLMTHPLSGFSGGRVSQYIGDDGITAGDAIRFDVVSGSASENLYTKAQADAPENAEIVGVVESVDNGTVNVVLSGQIVYPSSRLVNSTHIDETLGTSGATGGNDIFFLSEVTAGAIQNLAPNTPTRIAKPILQQAGDGTFTHHVVNYIGYQVGGSVVANDSEDPENLTLKTIIPPVDSPSLILEPHQYDASKKNFIPKNSESPEFLKIGATYNRVCERITKGRFGSRWKLQSSIPFIESLWLNKAVYFVSNNGERVWKGKVESFSNDNMCAYVTTTETRSPDISMKLHSSTGQIQTINYSNHVDDMLPQTPSTSRNLRTKNVNGSVVNIQEHQVWVVPPDGGYRGVYVPSDVAVKNLQVTNTVTLENTTTKIEDVAGTIKALSDEMTSIRREVNGLSTSASASAANITTKS